MCVMAMHPKFSTNRRRSGGCILMRLLKSQGDQEVEEDGEDEDCEYEVEQVEEDEDG
jgi:hypothetical protein